jgi:hypothetical protein
MLRVDSEDSYQRVNGTAIGGGTFWGLCHLLTGVSDFDQMLDLSKQGRADKVDLLVGDIYGADYSKIGLPATTTASSFGKVLYKDKKLSPSDVTPGDIATSLLRMISNNIGQIAYLTAVQHGLKRSYFGGFFIRNHPDTMSKISFAINYWSQGRMKAHFLTHEGYLGAVGALIAENRSLSEKSKEWFELKKRQISDLVSRTIFGSATIKGNVPKCSCNTPFCQGIVCKTSSSNESPSEIPVAATSNGTTTKSASSRASSAKSRGNTTVKNR